MGDTYTPNISIIQPQVGSSQDTWGTKLNSAFSTIDAVFSQTGTSVSLNVGSGKTLNAASGTVNLGSGGWSVGGTTITSSAAELNILSGKSSLSGLALAILPTIYPVGSLYFNASVGTNPATLLGFGTWSAYGTGRLIASYSSGSSYFGSVGATGGSTDAVLVSHQHGITNTAAGDHYHTYNYVTSGGQVQGNAGAGVAVQGLNTNTTNTSNAGSHTHAATSDIQGVSAAGANLPPFITVYIWQRTA